MNRELFQRYALVTIVVLLAVLAVNAGPWRQFGHRHRDGDRDRCRVERNVERRVQVTSIAPLPPIPPVPPLPPLPPLPPEASAADMERFEREVARYEVRVAREMEAHERAVEAHERALERSHRRRERAPSLMVVAAAPSRADILYERSFDFRAGDALVVALSSEDVVVETNSGSGATVRVEGRGPDARREFERRRFEATYAGGSLRVRTDPRPSLMPRRTRADFTVTISIPARARVQVATSSGDVVVGNIQGPSVSVTTSSGDMDLGTVTADEISLTAASGNIEADALEGDTEVATSSGDVEVSRLAGAAARLSASSGNLQMGRVESRRFSATTSSGDVHASGLAAPATVATGSGDVELAFARPAVTDVRTGSGEVQIAFGGGAGADLHVSAPDVDIASGLSFNGTRERRNVTGRIGAGGPTVSVSTGSGGVELVAR